MRCCSPTVWFIGFAVKWKDRNDMYPWTNKVVFETSLKSNESGFLIVLLVLIVLAKHKRHGFQFENIS